LPEFPQTCPKSFCAPFAHKFSHTKKKNMKTCFWCDLQKGLNCVLQTLGSLFHSHLQYCIIDWGRAYKTVIRQVLQNRIVKYMTFSNRTSSASNIFKLLKILQVSDLYQLNLEKFMYKYNVDILPSSFDNFFSKLYNIRDHGTRQQVSRIFHYQRVRTDYGKKMLQYVGPVACGCISNKIRMLPLHTFSNQVKSRLLAGYWLLCAIYTVCDFLRCFWELSLNWAHLWFFISFWTHVLCFTCNIETWQSLNVGWAWLSDCFSRLSPNLCCLFQALSIEMCFTAEYLQRKHDLIWLLLFELKTITGVQKIMVPSKVIIFLTNINSYFICKVTEVLAPPPSLKEKWQLGLCEASLGWCLV